MIRTLQLGQLGFSSAAASTAPPATYTTLNPADKDAGISLSGGNLVATGTVDNNGIVRAVHGKSTGKWYFEAVITTSVVGADVISVGLANATHVIGDPLGYSTTNGWAYWGLGGSGYRNGSLILSETNLAQGDVVGFHVDLDNDKLWVSRNGAQLQGDPATDTSPLSTNLTGTLYPAACPWKQLDVITMRFDPASHSYTPAAGFTPGWTA